MLWKHKYNAVNTWNGEMEVVIKYLLSMSVGPVSEGEEPPKPSNCYDD